MRRWGWIVLVLLLCGCGAQASDGGSTAQLRLPTVGSTTGTIDFGRGLDKTSLTITGESTTFTAGDLIYFVAHLSQAPGSQLRITLVRNDATTEQVAVSQVLGTPSLDERDIWDSLNTAFAGLDAGDYTLKIFHGDVELAQGAFSLVTPSQPAPASSDYVNSDSSDITAAVHAYQLAVRDVYGPSYSVSMLGEVATGKAARAVWCVAAGKPDSLVATHSYYTYSGTQDDFQPAGYSGNTATIPVHISQRITTHHADGTTSGYDAGYTMTFTLVNTGFAWKVSDYSWVGDDGSQGSATEDAQPCA